MRNKLREYWEALPSFTRKAILLAGVLALISLAFERPGPVQWLVDWTNWAFAFFALCFGGRALWWSSEKMRIGIQGQERRTRTVENPTGTAPSE